MLDAPPLKNLIAASLAAMLALFVASATAAETVDISLNVHYQTPSDPNSGGDWDLVAKSTAFGIAGLNVEIINIVPTIIEAPQGTVNGNIRAGFAEFDYQQSTNSMDIGQIPLIPPLAPGQEENVFYGVGTLQNGAPDYTGNGGAPSIGPHFNSLINLLGEIPWATTPDFKGDSTWDTAARFVSGTFAPGVTPAFLTGSTANVFTSLPPDNTSFGNIAEASVTAIVRTNLVLENADYNHNGIVDAADYVVWRSMLGQTGITPGTGADGTGDGNVDIADYNLWRATSAPPPAPVQVCPPTPFRSRQVLS